MNGTEICQDNTTALRKKAECVERDLVLTDALFNFPIHEAMLSGRAVRKED